MDEKWTDGQMEGQNRYMDGWMDGWMNRQMANGRLDRWEGG